jgi:hypothetical protein
MKRLFLLLSVLALVFTVPLAQAETDCREKEKAYDLALSDFSSLYDQMTNLSVSGFRQLFPTFQQREQAMVSRRDEMTACIKLRDEEAARVAVVVSSELETVKCPDCSIWKTRRDAKNAEVVLKEAELLKAKTDLETAQKSVEQTEKDFAAKLSSGEIPGCSATVSAGQTTGSTSQLSGTILKSNFDCRGDQSLRSLAAALDAIREAYKRQLNDVSAAQKIRDLRQGELSLLIQVRNNLAASLDACLKKILDTTCTPTQQIPAPVPFIPVTPITPVTPVTPEPVVVGTTETALVSFSATVETTFPQGSARATFSDLAEVKNQSIVTAVIDLGDRGLLLGMGGEDLPSSQPRPSAAAKSLLRAELAQLLYRGGSQLTGYKPLVPPNVAVFADVSLDAWYSDAFAWMAQNAFFVQGRPSATVNNAEAVTAVRRWLGLAAPVQESGKTWYDGEFALLIELKILPADYDYGKPDDPATRGFIALLIHKAIELGR